MVFSLVLTAWFAPAHTVFAQPDQAASNSNNSTVPLARRLFSDGVEAAHKSRWSVALDKFKRAYELAPRVKTLFNLAAAQMKVDLLLDSSESYRRFLRDTRDGRYPQLREDAQKVLAKLEKRIPYIRIRVIGVSAGDVLILDKNSFPHAGLGESLPINPGRHRIRVLRDGVEIGSKTVTLEEGSSVDADIVVEPAPVGAPVQPNSSAKSGTTASNSPPSGATNLTSGIDGGGEPKSGGVLRSSWFWAAVAVVVVGGAGAGFLLSQDRVGDPTQGTLGRGILEL